MLAERTPRAHRALQRQLELAKHVGGERRCDIRAVAMLFEERLQRNQRTVPLLPVRRRARESVIYPACASLLLPPNSPSITPVWPANRYHE